LIHYSTGWALTLLSQDCLSYASTCQTIGLNTGFFASFTVFLAFNSEAFAYVLISNSDPLFSVNYRAKWGVPHLTLGAYLQFWSIICFLVTFWLLIFKKEVCSISAKRSITGTDVNLKRTKNLYTMET
jgi:MFS transporter, PAT family, solute carrier family 33 (acetyl-CoA transportor), member 1